MYRGFDVFCLFRWEMWFCIIDRFLASYWVRFPIVYEVISVIICVARPVGPGCSIFWVRLVLWMRVWYVFMLKLILMLMLGCILILSLVMLICHCVRCPVICELVFIYLFIFICFLYSIKYNFIMLYFIRLFLVCFEVLVVGDFELISFFKFGLILFNFKFKCLCFRVEVSIGLVVFINTLLCFMFLVLEYIFIF